MAVSEHIKIENLTIDPAICAVNAPVDISVVATNYGDYTALKTIKFNYWREVNAMTVTFSGSVSKQAAAGETVTITVTLPDGSTEQVTATTLSDKTFLVEYTNIPGNYKAKAGIVADALYLAAESNEVSFVIEKEPRTITMTVTP